MAAVLPKQKLSAAYFRNSESNGLYEHCFVLCRGLLICLQIFHYKGAGVLSSSPTLLKGVKNGIEHSDRRIDIKGSVVTRPIPPNCVAVGNPCGVIRYFDTDRERWQHEV